MTLSEIAAKGPQDDEWNQGSPAEGQPGARGGGEKSARGRMGRCHLRFFEGSTSKGPQNDGKVEIAERFSRRRIRARARR